MTFDLMIKNTNNDMKTLKECLFNYQRQIQKDEIFIFFDNREGSMSLS